jgi:imidazolonepropionase-like amidohydrolase
MNTDYLIDSPRTPGRYMLAQAGDELTCGDMIEVKDARTWRPARIEHDAGAYVAIYTDAQGGAVRLCAGLPARRRPCLS